MIIARLFGGAGNQLFQYAAARALADYLGCGLALDNRAISDHPIWADGLDHFANIRRQSASLPPAKSNALRYALWRYLRLSPKFYREHDLGYDPALFDLPVDTYLHGYWQSEKYFRSIDRLRQDLQMTTPLDPANQDMADQIMNAKTAISVHLRRGDYLASGSYVACSADYYQSAVQYLSDTLVQDLTCFVFSNDPAWARDNLELGTKTIIVDLNDERAGHFDMHLMSLCDHHIIANSTFSWWGAWLNPDPKKQVIAPKNWFTEGHKPNPDICPESWVRL